jgi:N-sulfoglucosamine sulfohydrolase
MTGRWPHRNGAEGFEPIADGVPVLTTLLADAGYRTGIVGKVAHLQPTERFGWDHAVDMADLGMGRDPRRYEDEMRAFVEAAGESPWFLMFNAHDPHRPFHGAEDVGRFFDAQQQAGIPAPSRIFSAEEAGEVPGYLPDVPDVRREYAQYLSSARRCDDVVDRALGALDDLGLAENTVVVFLSDNGMAFPFSKANCYLQSTRTPFIVRWPGEAEAGRRVAGPFVSMLDLFATFCEIAGADAAPNDGSSLVLLLTGRTAEHRDHVVTVFHETAGKRRYEMRCVQDGTYGYIWNGWADGETDYQAENMMGLSWPAIREAAEKDPDIARRVAFYQRRQVEELYDLDADPNALHDLSAERPDVLTRMRDALRAWMRDTADPRLDLYEAQLAAA